MADTVLQILIKGVDQGASSTLQSVLQETLGLSEGQAALGVSMLAATGATMGMLEAFNLLKEGLTSVIEQSAAWQTQLSQAQANTTLTTEQVQAMGAAVVQMSQTSGASLADLGGGYVHIANIMQDTTTAVNVLNVAQESAISTGGNVSSYAQTLARVLHEFSMSGNEAAAAMDMLHTAAASGDLTLEQFTANSGNALAMAANYKVPLDEVSAAYIALTKHGMDAADANTQMADQFLRLTTVTPKVETELQRVSKATGVDLVGDFTSSGLAAKGLTGIYADLTDAETKMGMTSEQAFAENMLLGDSLRGGRGLAILAGNGLQDYTTTLAAVDDATASATKRQDDYNRALETAGGQFNVLKANASALAVTIGGNQGPMTDFLATINRTFAMVGTGADLFGTLASAWTSDADVGKALSAEIDHIGGSLDAASGALSTQTADLYNWGQTAVTAGAQVASAINDAAAASAAATSAFADKQANDTLQSDHNTAAQSPSDYVTKSIAADQKTAYDAALVQAKQFYTDQAKTATDAATTIKDVASAANQAELDSTKQTIADEKTAYDDGMAQAIKDSQTSTQSQLADLAKLNTAQNVAAAAANTAAGVAAAAANTSATAQAAATQKSEDNKLAAIQHTADESDTAWKNQVTAIKDAATAGENALHTSNDAILKNATDTANDNYNTQIAAIDGIVKAREESDARDIHSHELATAADIAAIEKEKTAAIAAIDEETAAYTAQEAARVKLIDATLSASVKGLNDQLAAEKQANTDRLAVNAMTKSSGAAAGSELGSYFTASEAATSDTEAAIAAKQAGNQTLAASDTAAAAQQTATAKALSDQLSQISQTVSDQMVTYRIASDTTITADNVAALTQQATDQKQGLADQLTTEKAAQADKKQAATDFYDGKKAQDTQALADYKWTMAQNLQAFKDEKAQEKADDKTALDLKLTNIGIQQTAENTRHDDAIRKITEQSKTDTAAIDALALKRKDEYAAEVLRRAADYTSQTTQQAAAYTAATAARTADYNAQTAARLLNYNDQKQKITDVGAADVLAMQKAQKEADLDYPKRTAAADAHYKEVQGQVDTSYKQDVNAIQDGLKEHNDALTARAKAMTDYTTTTDTSWQTLIKDANDYRDAINGQVTAQENLNKAQQASGKGMQTGTGNAGGTGGGASIFGGSPGSPPADSGALGQAVVNAAAGWLDSYAYGSGADTFCERFVANMEGRPVQGTAYDAYNKRSSAGQIRSGGTPPPGAEVYFAPDASNEYMGHTGISLGGGQFESVTVDGIRDYSISAWDANAWGAPYLGWVPAVTPMYLQGGVVPGPYGQPSLAVVHGGEEYLGMQGQRGTLASRGGGVDIDYDKWAAAMARQPIIVTMNSQKVAEIVRTELLKQQRSNTTLGFR